MATIPTQNAVPSEAPRDLKFNSGKIDEFVTSLEHEYKDRFGRCHMTIEGMRWIFEQLMERFKVDINQAIIAAGYIPMDSFQQGAEITKRNEILRDETTGEYYRWDGDLPKTVPAGSTPESAGGIGMGAWVSVGDASLRGDLSNDGDNLGDSLIAVRQPFSGAVVRTQHDKNSDIVSSADVGVSSDDSTTQFTNLDSEGVSVLITSDEISVADDIPGTVHLSLKEITQSGAGAVPIRNLSRKNILPKNNKIYDVTTGYDFDYRQDNIIKNSTFFVWHNVTVGKKNIGMPTNLSASANAMICAFWRMETTANVTCGGISKISSPAGGLHFVATYGSTGGFVYLRQNINGVQAFGTKTFTACIDLEVNGNCEMDYYARMRINSSNDAALRPLIVDSENIDVISGRHRYAITFTCPDVDSFRGTENSQNSMEIAFRIHGAEQTLAVNVRGITVSPGSHIPHPMMSDPQKDVCDADVMYRIAPFGIGGFTDAIGQRRYAVDIGCLRYTAGSLSIYDMAGNSNVISTYSLDGKRTDNVPFTLTADNMAYGSFQLLLQSSTASGMAGWYVYNAYP